MGIFVELSLIFVVATVVAIIARSLKQPLVVGYIIGGVVAGPYVLNILQSTEHVELFSKIGIAVLLFIVGLNLNPDSVRETGKAALVTGIGQIAFTSIIGFFIVRLLGFDTVTSLYAAMALTFSSTIIILKLLSDKGDLGKLYGKISIGFLLVQDFVATILLVLVPFIGAQAPGGAGTQFFLPLLVNGLTAGAILYAVSKYILPRLSLQLAYSQELLFIFAVAWGLGLASLFAWMGFSIEIGALVAGVTLSVSSYSFEISSRMRPLRDFFIVLFFVLLGAHLDISHIGSIIPQAIILSLFVLVGNPLIVFFLMNLLGYRSRTGFLAGLTVAQISEFSLILMASGFSFGQVSQEAVSLITLVGLITIAGSTYLIMYGDRLYRLLKPLLRHLEIRRTPHREHRGKHEKFDMIILGYGRVGHEFVAAAQEIGASYVVVDYDPRAIIGLRDEGVSFRFGDAEDVEFLEEIGLAHAKVVVSTIPDAAVNALVVRQYRRRNAEGIVIPIAHGVADAQQLYLEGATYVVLPHHLGAEYASSMILKHHDEPEAFERIRNKHLSRLADSE